MAGVVWARALVLLRKVESSLILTWRKVERGVGKVTGGARPMFLNWLIISLGVESGKPDRPWSEPMWTGEWRVW